MMKTTMMIGLLALTALAMPASADGNCNNYGVVVNAQVSGDDCSWEGTKTYQYQYCDQGSGAGAGAGAGGAGSSKAGASATAGTECHQSGGNTTSEPDQRIDLGPTPTVPVLDGLESYEPIDAITVRPPTAVTG